MDAITRDCELMSWHQMNNIKIIRFAGKAIVINLADQQLANCLMLKQWLQKWIHQKWGLEPERYFIDLRPNTQIIEIQPRINGGSIKSIFRPIFRGVVNGFLAIFKPIAKPLVGIANAFLMLLKGIVYIIMLFTWFIKFLAWVFMEVLPSIPTDIFGLVRFFAEMIIDGFTGTIGYYLRKLVNTAGGTVFGAALTGWDNNPDETPTTRARQSTDDFDEIPGATNNKSGNRASGPLDKIDCAGRKCYKTEAGTVPWTVILATVLFPPSGVFMELGLTGWIQILVCILLTLMFYFPGLIYALIILYC